VEQANASGKTPVVLIHGLWLLPSSWDNWVDFFEENGYAGLTPDWPGDPEGVHDCQHGRTGRERPGAENGPAACWPS
jgi:hypothetical protein